MTTTPSESKPAYRPHRWWSKKCHGVLIGTYFEPPPQSFKFDKGGSVEGRGYHAQQLADRLLSLYEKALQGVTTLTWRCSQCGDIWTTTKPGKVTVADLDQPDSKGCSRPGGDRG